MGLPSRARAQHYPHPHQPPDSDEDCGCKHLDDEVQGQAPAADIRAPQRDEIGQDDGVGGESSRASYPTQLIIPVMSHMNHQGVFVERINAMRKGELEGLAVRKYLDALCVYLWASTGQLISSLMFGIMAAGGTHVSAGSAFAALALFQGLIGPLNALPWVLNGILEALVSIDRVQSFLLRSEARSGSRLNQSDHANNPPQAPTPQASNNEIISLYPDCLALASEATCSWHNSHVSTSKSDHPHQPCLVNVSLIIPRGSLVVIVGPVGSGKSSLLAALAGELVPQKGRCEIKEGIRVGYIPQTPWCLSGTVRENVCLGSTLGCLEEEERYQRVVHACALTPDLSVMKDGDLTLVGERGGTLSGGQRARRVRPLSSSTFSIDGHSHTEAIIFTLSYSHYHIHTINIFTLQVGSCPSFVPEP